MEAIVEPVRVPAGPSLRAWCSRHGFSPELVARWVEFLPDPQALLESLLRPTPRYLRVNTLRTDEERLAKALGRRGFLVTPVPAPNPRLSVLRLDKEPFAISATPEYLGGEAYLQDLASLTAAAALTPRPGERILDMAAAPGGKTTAVAELVQDDAAILAVEPVPSRAAALTANLRRLGVGGVGVVVGRAEELPGAEAFDRILLDAPCTGEGVIPRDPGRRTGDLGEHRALGILQRRLVDAAVRLLRPGGTLVYSTCTFAPEECESVVAYAVRRGLAPEPLPFDELAGVPLDPPLVGLEPFRFGAEVRHARRMYPHRHPALGFFVARLTKPEDAPGVVAGAAAARLGRGVSAGRSGAVGVPA